MVPILGARKTIVIARNPKMRDISFKIMASLFHWIYENRVIRISCPTRAAIALIPEDTVQSTKEIKKSSHGWNVLKSH